MTGIPVDDADPANLAARFAAHIRAHPGAATDESTLAAWFGTAIAAGREIERDEILADPEKAARLAGIAGQRARTARLTALYGKPEHMNEAEAIALAALGADVTPGDVYASVYRDGEAADAFAASNLAHHGHPTLAKVQLPDGRVVGILDLRPSLERFARGEDEDP